MCTHSWCLFFVVDISSSYEDTSHIGLGPTQQPYFNLIVSLKALSPNPVTFGDDGDRVSTYKFGSAGDTIQPITWGLQAIFQNKFKQPSKNKKYFKVITGKCSYFHEQPHSEP